MLNYQRVIVMTIHVSDQHVQTFPWKMPGLWPQSWMTKICLSKNMFLMVSILSFLAYQYSVQYFWLWCSTLSKPWPSLPIFAIRIAVIIVIIVDVVIVFFTVDVVFIIVEFTMQQPSFPGMVTQPLRTQDMFQIINMCSCHVKTQKTQGSTRILTRTTY